MVLYKKLRRIAWIAGPVAAIEAVLIFTGIDFPTIDILLAGFLAAVVSLLCLTLIRGVRVGYSYVSGEKSEATDDTDLFLTWIFVLFTASAGVCVFLRDLIQFQVLDGAPITCGILFTWAFALDSHSAQKQKMIEA